MSETRAKAQALRDAVNVGATSLEELHDSDNSGNSGSSAGNSAGSGASSGSERGSGQRASGSRNQMHDVQGGQADQGSSGVQGSQAPQAGSPEPAPPEEGDSGYGGADVTGGRTNKAPKSQIDFIKTLYVIWNQPYALNAKQGLLAAA